MWMVKAGIVMGLLISADLWLILKVMKEEKKRR